MKRFKAGLTHPFDHWIERADVCACVQEYAGYFERGGLTLLASTELVQNHHTTCAIVSCRSRWLIFEIADYKKEYGYGSRKTVTELLY